MADESKLPKWAQEEMGRLRQRVADLTTERDQILAGGGDRLNEGFWFEGNDDSHPDIPAGLIRRRLCWRGTTGAILLTQQTWKPDGTTWLYLNGASGAGLQIRPGVSNTIFVRCARHNEG